MDERGIGYKELALLLEDRLGEVYTPGALTSRISRGTFTFDFFLKLASAMDIDVANLTQFRLPPRNPKSK